METLDEAGQNEVDDSLASWRQGDFVLGEHWFLFRTDAKRPLTSDAAIAAGMDGDVVEVEVCGFVIITQTCDIVRRCGGRPFVEVCPLVKVDDTTFHEVEFGRRPNYAFVPGAAQQQLVADLDRVMTIEKSVVAGWVRVEGCTTDADTRRLSRALARKRARMAFPDDFVAAASKLTSRLSSKHDKDSDEGRALRSLREIRVQASPSWDADRIELMFFFIRNEDDPTIEQQDSSSRTRAVTSMRGSNSF